MKFTEWMNNNRHPDSNFLCKRITCKDGFSVSVQASEYGYCYPRENLDNYDCYMEFELGFPSESDTLILQYAEERDIPTKTVYGFVPKGVIEKLIHRHGGIKQ